MQFLLSTGHISNPIALVCIGFVRTCGLQCIRDASLASYAVGHDSAPLQRLPQCSARARAKNRSDGKIEDPLVLLLLLWVYCPTFRKEPTGQVCGAQMLLAQGEKELILVALLNNEMVMSCSLEDSFFLDWCYRVRQCIPFWYCARNEWEFIAIFIRWYRDRKEFLLYPPLKKNADYKKKTVFLCLYFMLSYYIMRFLDLQFTYIYISTDFISSQQNPPLTWLGLELGTLDVQSERSTNSPSEGELTASVLMIIIKVKLKAPIWSLVSFNSR